MTREALRRLMPVVLGGVPWLAAAAATAQHAHGPAPAEPAPREQRFKADKKGEVRLTVETRVGELRLKPGRYRVEHRVDGPDHFVYFAESSERNRQAGAGETEPQARRVAIKCRVAPADTKDSATVFTVQEGLGALLTRVLIETVVECR
jgi:hypothetical protein